jgi:hypothetical protein
MKHDAQQKKKIRLLPIHVTTAISVALHLVLLFLFIILTPKAAKIAAEHFQIVVVSEENDLDLVKEKPADPHRALTDNRDSRGQHFSPSRKADDSLPPPLPPPAYPTQAPPSLPHEEPGADERSTPPPLPLPVDETGTTAVLRPALKEGNDNGQIGAPAPESGPSNQDGKPHEGTGGKKVAALPMEGNKLFILPPRDEPLSIKKALELCEGLNPAEEARARKIEFKVRMETTGQPAEMELTRSCGDKRIDEEVKNLMDLMRFDTAGVKNLTSCYLTLILVGGKKS